MGFYIESHPKHLSCMKNYETAIELLFEKAEDCGKTTLELMKLKVINSSVEIISSLAVRVILIMVITLFTFITNIGIALWIGDLLGKSYYGFFIVAAFYGLMAILLRSYLHQWISVPISNFIIALIVKNPTP